MNPRKSIHERIEGVRDFNLIYIFCEGIKREVSYFDFFNRLNSRIIRIMDHVDGHQTPMGLFNTAVNKFFGSNGNPEFEFVDGDQAWFVVDTDQYLDEIRNLRLELREKNNWFIAQSNPCFEVWLYYHFYNVKPDQHIINWKMFLNEKVVGGFDNRKHPYLIEEAIKNSKKNFSLNGENPDLNCTEVHNLSERIVPLVSIKL